jgi:Predicted DNA modification methylase
LKSYYSTFIPGLVQPVKEALGETLPDSRINLALDGLIAYESNAKTEVIQNLPFVTNSFHIIKSFDRQSAPSLEDMAMNVVEDRSLRLKPLPRAHRNTFRIITSIANQLVPIDNNLMQALEERVSNKTGLKPNRAKPDYEFWLTQRSEGYGYFAFRLSHHKAYDKSLQKGELRPELANILCRLSGPLPDELFLDPFCGSGAIPIQRAKFFPKGLVIASDIDEQKVNALKVRIKALGLTKRVVVRRDDALNMTRYQPGSIHKIVTDPPWGHFMQMSSPIADFYARMLGEFSRILRPNGRTVMVTGETLALDNSLDRHSSRLTVAQRFNILLSGKKAGVYVLMKRSDERDTRSVSEFESQESPPARNPRHL